MKPYELGGYHFVLIEGEVYVRYSDVFEEEREAEEEEEQEEQEGLLSDVDESCGESEEAQDEPPVSPKNLFVAEKAPA